ncbi:glycosyltransferase family 39 protein [bacterium]|nr:glycosyltransferase family 39 protein [bacterium]
MLSFQNRNYNSFLLNNTLILLILILITISRIIALTLSPIELSVDEAQYWHWSQDLQMGYFTKPPMIAWIIAFSTNIFGQEEWAVRICSPIMHFLISMSIWIGTHSIFGSKSAKIAALIWIFTPAASLGSFIISSDTPLLLFWTFALVTVLTLLKESNIILSICLGLAIGLAFLSKYAALYFIIFFFLWWIIYDRGKNFKPNNLILIFFTCLIIASANLYWNYANDFVTLNHTVSNADLSKIILNFNNMIEFIASQLLVFGPVLMLLFLFLVFQSFYKNKSLSLLAMLSLPIIILITIQSYLKIANANWAITAYIAASIILSSFVVNNKKKYIRFFFKIGITTNVVISVFILNVTTTGSLYPFELKSNPLRKNIGYESQSNKIDSLYTNNMVSAVLFQNRSDITRFNYYLNRFDDKFKGKIFLLNKNIHPGNYYEKNYSFNHALFKTGDKVLILSQNINDNTYANLSSLELVNKISYKTGKNTNRNYYVYKAYVVK